AKQTSDPFSLSDHKFESVGDLVHQDLCGPYRVVNKDGYKYFLTAADDYRRAVWAYLIETKDEVAFYIESFVELICTQFNKKAKVFSMKKAYKLYGVENKAVFLSRDVTFYETIFPIKMKSDSLEIKSNDNEGESSNGEGDGNINNGDEPPTMRRSTKSTEPKTYLEVAQDKNWVEAMNSEMKAFWPLYQLDVNNVFLYDDLNEDVYMDLPLGCYDESETKVCKLVNSLYGLKQAPRQWNEKLTTALKENGFKQSINDYSLFVNYDNGVFLALLVYVDHIVLTELWCEYGLLACKRAATPMQQNVNLNHIEFDKDKKLKSLTKYYKLVGKLIYMSLTRPDISYVVHSLSQHMHSHFTAALRVSSTCEVVWLVNLLKDLDVEGLLPVSLYCDSSFANQIAANHIFHEKIKHSGIDVHLVRENFAS
ncbi:ribonuclease H-like domain-containing protein, partial [Tanacetum coccineum]